MYSSLRSIARMVVPLHKYKSGKVQAVHAKREFDEKAKNDKLAQYYDATYFYCYNRLRKLKRAKNPDADKISAVAEAFKFFRKEAIKRKGMVKREQMKVGDFTSWLAKQQDEVDTLME